MVGARQEHTGRVKARGVRRLHKLHQRRYEKCAPGIRGSSKISRCAKSAQAATSVAQVVCARSTDLDEQTRGVCPRRLYKRYSNITAPRSSLSVENYQHGGQYSARGKAGLKIRRQEYGRLSGMVFQAPRQPVALQQANLRNRIRVAAAIRLGQRSGDCSRRLG